MSYTNELCLCLARYYTELTSDEKQELQLARREGMDPASFFKKHGLNAHFVLQAALFDNVYGLRARCSAFLFDAIRWPEGLVIQVKTQETSGTTDEKIPFAALSLLETRRPAALVLEGEGLRPEIIRWGRDFASKNHDLTLVHGWKELHQLVKNGFACGKVT